MPLVSVRVNNHTSLPAELAILWKNSWIGLSSMYVCVYVHTYTGIYIIRDSHGWSGFFQLPCPLNSLPAII